MPVFRSGPGQAPAWCELSQFEILTLRQGARHVLPRSTLQAKLIVVRGHCRLTRAGTATVLAAGSQLDLPADDPAGAAIEAQADAQLVCLYGCWGDERGGSGLFSVVRSAAPQDAGDRVSYPKTTNFDCHYHDCDEYWILVAGRATVMTEGKHYVVAAGDCVATGMGHHHDVADVVEPVEAVFFETTLAGKKRRGHLWEHTHGPAQPLWDRV